MLKPEPLRKQLDRLEKHLIIVTFEQFECNKSKTARILGISRSKLIYKLKQYSVDKRH